MPITDPKTDDYLDRCEHILGLLEDTFGPDDIKHQRAYEMYSRFIQSGTESSCRLALMYLEWCVKYPNRIGMDDKYKSECGKCTQGFFLDDREKRTWRPCVHCLPKTHDEWQEETGFLYDNG